MPLLTPSTAKSKEWRWLLMNLLVLPGLGSIQGGHRRTGYCQLILGLVGFLLTLVCVLRIGIEVVHALQNETPLQPDHALIGWATIGASLFFVSWFWALATGIEMVRGNPSPPLVSG